MSARNDICVTLRSFKTTLTFQIRNCIIIIIYQFDFYQILPKFSSKIPTFAMYFLEIDVLPISTFTFPFSNHSFEKFWLCYKFQVLIFCVSKYRLLRLKIFSQEWLFSDSPKCPDIKQTASLWYVYSCNERETH